MIDNELIINQIKLIFFSICNAKETTLWFFDCQIFEGTLFN